MNRNFRFWKEAFDGLPLSCKVDIEGYTTPGGECDVSIFSTYGHNLILIPIGMSVGTDKIVKTVP